LPENYDEVQKFIGFKEGKELMFPMDFDRDSISTGTMRKTHETMIPNYGYEKV